MRHAGPEHDVGLDRHVAADLGVVREPDRVGRDQGDAVGHRLGRRRRCHSASTEASSARLLTPTTSSLGLDHRRAAVRRRGEHDDVGKIIFAGGIVVADPREKRPEIGGARPPSGRNCTGRRRAPPRSHPYTRPSSRSCRRRRRGSGHNAPDRADGSRRTTAAGVGSPWSRSSIARIVSVSTSGVSP